ncbi:hypothetical protein AAF712_016580 [Marasmius tenuissimus]|uniref:Uncharacterized protein n=1 Tax=Marasmius tenuissimus TaxID=585030 RepID=A0ABR2Z5E4_9AGAR
MINGKPLSRVSSTTIRSVKHADFQEELAKIVQAKLEAKVQELKNFSHLVLADVSEFQYEDICKVIVIEKRRCDSDEWPQEFRLQPVSVPRGSEPGMCYDQNLKKWLATYMQAQPQGTESPFVFEDITERLRDSPRFDATLNLHALLAHPVEDGLPPALLRSLLDERVRDGAYCMYAIPECVYVPSLSEIVADHGAKLKSKLSLWRYKPQYSLAYNTTTSSPFAILTVEHDTEENLVKSILHGYIRMKWAYQLAIGEEKTAVKNLCILCLWAPKRGEDEFDYDLHRSWVASVLYFSKPASEDEIPSIVSVHERFEGQTGKVHLVQLVGLVLHRNCWALSKALQERFSDAAVKMEACLEASFQRFLNVPTAQDGDRQRQESGWNPKLPRTTRSQIRTTSGGRGSTNLGGSTTRAPQYGSTIPLTMTMDLILPFRYIDTGDGIILFYGNTRIKVSPQPVAIELVADGFILVQEDMDRGEDEKEDNVGDKDYDQMEIEEFDDLYTMEIPTWSALESKFSDIIKRVVDNYSGLDPQLQETSVVPKLYHTDDEAVTDLSVIITSHPGNLMEDIPFDIDEGVARKLAIEFLEHMVTLVRRGYLWIDLDPESDVLFDLASMQVKLFIVRAPPTSRTSADYSILHAASSFLVTLSTFAGGAGSILKELGDRLIEKSITMEGSAMSDSGSVMSVFRDALGFIRSHIALDQSHSPFLKVSTISGRQLFP